MRLPAVLAPLRHRDFRLLWIGQTVSGFGNGVSNIAVPFQLIALGATPLQIGFALGIETATSVAFLLVGGAVADRVSRRALILASDLLGAFVAAALALVSGGGLLRIEHVYLAAAGLGAADAFLSPAYNAIIADLVPAEVLRAGNAARLLGRSLARIVGPTVGGLVVALASPAAAFGVDAVTFGFSFAVLLLARPAIRAATATSSLMRDIRSGFGYVFSVPWLWTAILYFMLVNVAYAGAGVMTPFLVLRTLGGDARMYGVVSAAVGVGTIAASIGIAQVVTRRPGRLLFAFEALAAACTLVIGLLPVFPVVLAAMALTGLALASSTVIWQALLQRHVPERMLGRVSSIDLLGNSVINPIAPLAAAALIDAVGPPATFAIAGGYALALVGIGLLASPLRAMVEERPTAA